ncbi:hypothetical protein CR513_37256, partial [Mucuna pruriens]
MEVVVDDVKERHEALRNDVNQLKEQTSQILEMLNAPKQPQVTPDHPPGFTPNQPQNQTQYPLYGLPPGCTPPVKNNIDPHTTTSNLQNQTQPQDLSCRTNDG